MQENFKKSCKNSPHNIQIKAVNGCCYDKDENPDKGDYFKLCGHRIRTKIFHEWLDQLGRFGQV